MDQGFVRLEVGEVGLLRGRITFGSGKYASDFAFMSSGGVAAEVTESEAPKRSAEQPLHRVDSAQRPLLLSSSSTEDFMDTDQMSPSVDKRRRLGDAVFAEASTQVVDGSKRPARPIRTTEAAPIPTGQHGQCGEGEVTLRRCLHLLQFGGKELKERPAHITEELVHTQLFVERPKQKRTASKWGDDGLRADRWANSGGVSGAHDFFPDGKSSGTCSG